MGASRSSTPSSLPNLKKQGVERASAPPRAPDRSLPVTTPHGYIRAARKHGTDPSRAASQSPESLEHSPCVAKCGWRQIEDRWLRCFSSVVVTGPHHFELSVPTQVDLLAGLMSSTVYLEHLALVTHHHHRAPVLHEVIRVFLTDGFHHLRVELRLDEFVFLLHFAPKPV